MDSAPRHIKVALNNPRYRKSTSQMLYMRRSKRKEKDDSTVRVWADEQEKLDMEKCHKQSVSIIKAFVASLSRHQTGRALEVACGDGRLTCDLLADVYEAVDLFDIDHRAIEAA